MLDPDVTAVNLPAHSPIMTKQDKELINKLLPFAEPDEGEERKLFIRGSNLKQTGVSHDQLWQKSEKNLVSLKRSSPPGWYIHQPPKPIPSNILRNLARKLLTSSSQVGKGKQALHIMAFKEIKAKIKSSGHEPEIVIPQMIAKHYLVICLERTNSYYIFTKQKKGKALAKQIAAK